jgi:hypothetical protein
MLVMPNTLDEQTKGAMKCSSIAVYSSAQMKIVTHFLLPTLVAGSLDTRLPLLFAVGLVIVMVVVVVNEAARAALETSQAGAPLALGIGCAAVPRADRAGRAHRSCPSRNHDGPTVLATARFAVKAAERGC